MRLHVGAGRELKIERQGSKQAEFLSCIDCGSLLAVRWEDDDGHAYGAVNAACLARREELADAQGASPKLFDAGAKAERWKLLWFADVSANGAR